MKIRLRVTIVVVAVMLSFNGFAQSRASSNASANIVSINDTGSLGNAGLKPGARGTSMIAHLITSNSSCAIQPVIIKGDFINMSLLGRKRRISDIR